MSLHIHNMLHIISRPDTLWPQIGILQYLGKPHSNTTYEGKKSIGLPKCISSCTSTSLLTSSWWVKINTLWNETHVCLATSTTTLSNSHIKRVGAAHILRSRTLQCVELYEVYYIPNSWASCLAKKIDFHFFPISWPTLFPEKIDLQLFRNKGPTISFHFAAHMMVMQDCRLNKFIIQKERARFLAAMWLSDVTEYFRNVFLCQTERLNVAFWFWPHCTYCVTKMKPSMKLIVYL